MTSAYHIPALLPQTMAALDVKPGGVYVDVTFGGGGHSMAIMELLDAAAGGHIYSFDQDMDAVSRAPHDERFTMVYSNFRYVRNFMRFYGVDKVDGLLADLGVSFHHFDDAGRGFSFRADGPLDMRMNRSARSTAADLLRRLTAEQLAGILKLYGELPQARRMAEAIVKARAAGCSFDTVAEFIAVIKPLIDPRREKKELAQAFQALRVEVNDEMGALREMLESSLELLRPGGRLAIITYHSLEDRMVKNFMRTGNVEGKLEKDVFGRAETPLKPLASKPITPDVEEVERNPRSRSAKLRVAVKL